MSSHFQAGEFYIHQSNSEVFIEVVEVLEKNSRYYRFRAKHWLLAGTGHPVLLSKEPATYRVFHGDEKQWWIFDIELYLDLGRRGNSAAVH
jgi:hypothetical protein